MRSSSKSTKQSFPEDKSRKEENEGRKGERKSTHHIEICRLPPTFFLFFPKNLHIATSTPTHQRNASSRKENLHEGVVKLLQD